MTHSDAFENEASGNTPRRARVVVLGEFSAGKSTLINLLTGARSLRTQITATQMPPVWMSYGTDAPYRVDLEGNSHPVDPSDPDSISVDDTAYVRSFVEAPALELCDFIDTPGNSDPNISAEAWERVAKLADVAIWCSSSTQAWRQSELSAWREVPEHVRARSILLLTRSDKITNEADREKIMRRVNREAGDLFSHIHMASLLKFTNARDVLSDLIALCNSVDSTVDVQTDATVAIADTMTQDSNEASADTAVAAPVDEPTPPSSEPEKADSVEANDVDMDVNVAEGANADIDSLLEGNVEDDLAALASLQAEYDDTDDVLAALTAEVDEQDAEQEQEEEQQAPTPEPVIVSDGYASALWTKMASAIPDDDADAYALAFDMFLERIDTEVATLRHQASLKAAG